MILGRYPRRKRRMADMQGYFSKALKSTTMGRMTQLVSELLWRENMVRGRGGGG